VFCSLTGKGRSNSGCKGTKKRAQLHGQPVLINKQIRIYGMQIGGLSAVAVNFAVPNSA